MKGPNMIPPKVTTVGELGENDTGIGTGAHDGMVLMFRVISGDEIWSEFLHPEEAEFISKMLVQEAKKARKQRGS